MEHPLTRLYRKNLATLITLLPEEENEVVQAEQPRSPAPTGLAAGTLEARERPNPDQPEPEEQVHPRPPGS